MPALLRGVAAHATRNTMDPTLPGAATLARSLFDDTPAAVCIYDARDLTLIATNSAANEDTNDVADHDADEQACPPTLWSHLPGSLRDDRRRAVTEALQTGRPVRIVGMIAGRWSQTVYRPATLADGTRALLVVTAAIAEGARVPRDHITTRRADADDLGRLEGLTERELEVMRLIGMGMSAEQVARELHRSAKTVQGHRNALGLKLGIENRVELARVAITAGLTAMDHDQVVELGRRSRRSNRCGAHSPARCTPSDDN